MVEHGWLDDVSNGRRKVEAQAACGATVGSVACLQAVSGSEVSWVGGGSVMSMRIAVVRESVDLCVHLYFALQGEIFSCEKPNIVPEC